MFESHSKFEFLVNINVEMSFTSINYQLVSEYVFKNTGIGFYVLRFPSRLLLLHLRRNQYQGTIVKLVSKFEKVDFKRRKAALDLNFLQTCWSFNVIQKFFQFRVANKNL